MAIRFGSKEARRIAAETNRRPDETETRIAKSEARRKKLTLELQSVEEKIESSPPFTDPLWARAVRLNQELDALDGYYSAGWEDEYREYMEWIGAWE